MLQVKFCSSILSKICLLFCISGTLLGYCRESFQEEMATIHGKNFNVSQITFNYLENTKQIGLFATGNRHHIWGELAGVTDKPFFQIGTGYRFLSKKAPLTQNSFWGLYTYLRPYDYVKYFERLGWTIGFEKANPSWQGTVNFYGCYAIKEINQFTNQYHEEKFGLSGRLSWYLMQRMTFLGRFNPFVFVAYTDAQHIKTNANSTIFFGIKNGGFGIRWEYACFTLEGRANWDSVKSGVFLNANYQLGLQIKLTDRYQTRGSYPIHRLYETPQGYKPNYNMTEAARAGFCSAYNEQRKKSGLPSQVMFENIGNQSGYLDPYIQPEELPIMVDNEEPKRPLIVASASDKMTVNSNQDQVFDTENNENTPPVSSHMSQVSSKPLATSLSQDTRSSSRKRVIRKPKSIRTTKEKMNDVNSDESTVIEPSESLKEQASPHTPTPTHASASTVLNNVMMESKPKETSIAVDETTDEEEFYTPKLQSERPNTPKPSTHSSFVPALGSFSRTKQSSSVFSPEPTPSKVSVGMDKTSHSEEETNTSSPSKHLTFSQKLQALATPADAPGMSVTTSQPLGIMRYTASSSGLPDDAQIRPPSTMQPSDDEVD